jgi:hypothetical protein
LAEARDSVFSKGAFVSKLVNIDGVPTDGTYASFDSSYLFSKSQGTHDGFIHEDDLLS